ncbi:aldo/keto reductase [Caulobacter sp. S45]|uniref:aldo/keto reductase n=1 Tax=Caulobacter sp. S45 TaxID=1641861 RepID=UPI00131AA5A3|nr:aldo/keto reductase [Caulobacter sp. S45]
MFLSNTLRDKRIPLAYGAGAIPAIGFGTLIRDPGAAKQAIKTALEVGFRHLDSAELYGTEDIAGHAMREAFEAGTVRRKEMFVTTKLWNNNHRPERVGPALEASLHRLQLDYVDCYLIHTPFAFPPGDEQHPKDEHDQVIYDTGVTLVETWRAMESLVDEGGCRTIGLSDIRLDKLKEIVAVARIKPAVVQVESHPYLPEWELLDFCHEQGIVLQAFAPLGHGMEPRVTEDPVITAIARRVHKTPAQVALAWAVQRGTALLTTSTNPDRIRENFDISPLPDDALREMHDNIATTVRFNAVVETGVPGFVPPPREASTSPDDRPPSPRQGGGSPSPHRGANSDL